MSSETITVTEVAYHRNGVSGEGFHAVLFTAPDDVGQPTEFLATVFDGPGRVAVIGVADLLEEFGVQFGINSWRGDYYEHPLSEAIEDFRDRPHEDYTDHFPVVPTIYPKSARPRLEYRTVTLTIGYDAEQWSDPIGWSWEHVALKMFPGAESVTVDRG